MVSTDFHPRVRNDDPEQKRARGRLIMTVLTLEGAEEDRVRLLCGRRVEKNKHALAVASGGRGCGKRNNAEHKRSKEKTRHGDREREREEKEEKEERERRGKEKGKCGDFTSRLSLFSLSPPLTPFTLPTRTVFPLDMADSFAERLAEFHDASCGEFLHPWAPESCSEGTWLLWKGTLERSLPLYAAVHAAG